MAVVRHVTSEGLQAQAAAISEALAPPGPITVMLMKAGHTFGQNPSFVASVATDEIVATNYARQLNSVAGYTQHADGTVSAAFSPTAFGLVGGAVNDTISGCYWFADTGNDATSPVYMWLELQTQQTTDGTALTIQNHPQSLVTAPSWI